LGIGAGERRSIRQDGEFKGGRVIGELSKTKRLGGGEWPIKYIG
jgi:hypothetical protein